MPVLYSAESDEESLTQFGELAERLIESSGMRLPIRCELFDSHGQRLALFVIGNRDADECYYRVDEVWRRSARGLILVIEDEDGRTDEVQLVIAKVQ
jgi:hypothetical protein